MPLGNGPPGVGQHVCPVPQASSPHRCPDSHPPNGLILAQLVIVQHGQLHLDLLETGRAWGKRDRSVREGGKARRGSRIIAKETLSLAARGPGGLASTLR